MGLKNKTRGTSASRFAHSFGFKTTKKCLCCETAEKSVPCCQRDLSTASDHLGECGRFSFSGDCEVCLSTLQFWQKLNKDCVTSKLLQFSTFGNMLCESECSIYARHEQALQVSLVLQIQWSCVAVLALASLVDPQGQAIRCDVCTLNFSPSCTAR